MLSKIKTGTFDSINTGTGNKAKKKLKTTKGQTRNRYGTSTYTFNILDLQIICKI